MNKCEDLDEQLLKKAIIIQIDKIEVPKNAKQKNWEKIQGSLNQSNSKLRTSKKRYIVVGLIASFLIFFVSIYASNSDSTAHLSPDDFLVEIDDSIVFQELERKEYTIEQAKEIASFDIIIPAYIPNNFDFQYVVSHVSELYYKPNQVTLYYTSKDIDDPLTIEQQYYGKGFSMGMTVDHAKIEHLTIDNMEMTLFTYKNDALFLMLELPHMLVSIKGSLDRDEIFKIAQSMM